MDRTHKSHPEPIGSPDGLKLLITVVNRDKSEFFADLIQSHGANMQLFASAKGTAKTEALEMLGLSDQRKSVLFSVINAANAEETLADLDLKFKTIKNGKGIAVTVPMTSVIGVTAYRFLADKREIKGLL